MSSILGANGKPVAEPEKDSPSTSNNREKSETRDVRTVPTGVLIFNLCLCANGLQLNRMTLDQVQMQMQQQKVIIDPPEVQQLKAILEHQYMARDVMVGELNFRFKDLDERRLAALGLTVEEDAPKEELT